MRRERASGAVCRGGSGYTGRAGQAAGLPPAAVPGNRRYLLAMRDADALRVAWYRCGRTLKARWTQYLALALLTGLLGGLAMGSVAAARRTQGAFPAYLASTSPSDLTVLTGLSGAAGSAGYDPAVIARNAALPGVRHVATYLGLNVAVQRPGATAAGAGSQGLPGSLDGEFFSTDTVTVAAGRMADPDRANEAVIDVKGPPSGVHVGTVAPLGFYANAQLPSLSAGKPVKPYLALNVRIVGAVAYSSEQAQDDIDVQRDGGALFTPALTRLLARCCAAFAQTAVQLTPGTSVASAERAIQGVLPHGFPVEFYTAAQTEARAERAVEPTSIALAVFGGIAALAGFLIAGQVIGRQLRRDPGDLEAMRALGAGRAALTADGLPGLLAAAVAGALLAVAVAAALSPLAPLGAVRAVYPSAGVAFDWPVLGGGAAVTVAALAAVSFAIARRRAPHRAPVAGRPARTLGSRIARAAQAAGLPVSAAEGIRLALDPGPARARVPVRPAILASVLASVAMLATVTFGASLTALVSKPALYGWNWTYALSSGQVTVGNAAAVLDRDPEVAAWTGIWFGTARLDGLTVPLIGAVPGAPVAPPLLSGHALNGPGQIVLGPQTLLALGKRVGGTVTMTDGAARPYVLRIVGTATLPALGVASTVHTEMGSGAVVPQPDIPGAAAGEPDTVLVTLKPGADLVRQQALLQRIVPPAAGGLVSGVQRPAEITGYRSMGTAPLILAGALAAGALASLGLTLAASVRRRGADLALLKTLGFTRRQLAATVAWQSTAAVAAGAVAGVPLGIALGRYLWDLFAGQISVIAEPSVPLLTVVLLVAGALAAANLVAAVPGRIAARTRASDLFRAQ